MQAWMGRARIKTLRTTAQDHCVPRFETQGCGICGHVRTALVDNANDPERYGDTLNDESVRTLPLGIDAPDRILEFDDRLDTGRHCLNSRIVEHQAIEHDRRQAAFPACRHILRIGVENFSGIGPQRIRG